MGLRGPGATAQKAARQTIDEQKRPRRLPWKKKGLSLAQQVIAFLEWLPTPGARTKKLKLLPSQREAVLAMFDTKRGKRYVNLAILSAAKGNGKSGLVSGVCLAALVGPLSQEEGRIYSASIDRKKAGVIYDDMKAVIKRVPEFASRLNLKDFTKQIEVIEPGDGFGSTFEALSSEAGGAQGLRPTLWCFDELGEARDGKLLEVLLESGGKRDFTLGIILSTQAESDDHPLSRLIDDYEATPDPRTFLQIHRAPLDADPFADETLKLANPAWGKFLDLAELENARDRARRIPAFEAGYRRLRLNQRVDTRQDNRLVTAAVWKDNAAPVDRAALRGRACFGGLDLAGKEDLCALVLVFPTDDKPARYDIMPFFWTPQGRMKSRTKAEQERFREWILSGYLTEVPGDVVTTALIAQELVALCKEFDVKTINYDKYHIEYLMKDLAEIGVELPMESFGQGHSKAMAPAIEFLAECALTARLRHGGNPVLTASVAGAVVDRDKAGNPMIDKPKSNKRGPVRIDGAIALTMALGAAKGWEPPPKKPSLDGFLANPVMVV